MGKDSDRILAGMLERLSRHNITSWIVAGSGFAAAVEAASLPLIDEIPYSMIPGMPLTTVHGHQPTLRVLGYNSRAVGVFLGRHHLYEGHSPDETCSIVRTAHACGGTHIILTNASGGLHPSLSRGDIVLLNDGIDFTFVPSERKGSRSTARSSSLSLFSADWTSRTHQQCVAAGVTVRSGVYAQVTGPSYETRAEIRMLRRIGADLVGMSTIQEAAYGAQAGMSVLGVSLVTNKASDTTSVPLSHLDVLETAATSVLRLTTVILTALDCV